MSEENVEIVRRSLEAFQRALEGDDPGAGFDTGMISEVRDGRVIRTTSYPDPADALAAAGLSE